MPDITMCTGGDCPLREKCYRYRATPIPQWQSYFQQPPIDAEIIAGKDTCTHFWPLTDTWGPLRDIPEREDDT